MRRILARHTCEQVDDLVQHVEDHLEDGDWLDLDDYNRLVKGDYLEPIDLAAMLNELSAVVFVCLADGSGYDTAGARRAANRCAAALLDLPAKVAQEMDTAWTPDLGAFRWAKRRRAMQRIRESRPRRRPAARARSSRARRTSSSSTRTATTTASADDTPPGPPGAPHVRGVGPLEHVSAPIDVELVTHAAVRR